MIEVELSNGTILEFPDGMSDDQIKEAIDRNFGSKQPAKPAEETNSAPPPNADIPDGMVFDPNTGGYVDTALQAQRAGQQQGPLASFIAGAPFVGEYFDEAVGQVDGFISGRNPEIATEQARQSRKQFEESNPKTAMGLEVAGGILGSLPLIRGGAGLAGRAPGLLGKSAAAGGLAAVGGALEGAVSGFGRGEDAKERKVEAAEGATVGGALGGVLGAAAPIFGAGARSAINRIKKIDFRVIADEFGVDPKTARVIKGFLANDDLDAAARKIAEIGDDAMLADAGLGTGQALDTAMSSGGEALRIGRQNIEKRAAEAGGRLSKQLDNILGVSGGIKSAAREISKKTAPARKRAFDKVYETPIDYASSAGRKIEDVLNRVPPKTLKKAIDEANEQMIVDGASNQQIIARIADDGSVAFDNMPNSMQVDMVKRALNDIARSETDEFGRSMSAAGIRASKLAGDLRDALSEAVPSYRTALKLGGDKIAQDNALRMGKGLLSKGVDLEDVREIMRDAPKDVREAAKRGLREGIENTLSNVRRTISDPNTDAREAMQLVKELSSRANKAKLNMVLGKNGADLLLSEMDKATTALELRAVVSANSKTAVRQFGQEAVEEATAPGVAGTLQRGEPVEAAKQVIQGLTGATDARSVAQREKVFGEIARVLTETRGKDAERALRIIQNATAGQPLRDAQINAIVRAGGAPLLSAIHQSGMQLLENR